MYREMGMTHCLEKAEAGNGRLWPNPAELAEALQRLPHDTGLRQPGPLVAVDLARSKRARRGGRRRR